jgi:hypothetical protein
VSDQETPKGQESGLAEQNDIHKKTADDPVPFKEETRQDQVIIVTALAISLIIVTAIFWFEITTILK